MFFANKCTFIDFTFNLEGIENKEVYLKNLLRKGTNINRVYFDFF